MNKDQFSKANEFGLTESEKNVKTYENLSSIVIKVNDLCPYSSLQIHTKGQGQTKLEWNTIFKRWLLGH